VAFVNANKLTTAANAIFLQATAPLYLLLFGPILLKERAARSDLLAIMMMATGMALFFWGGQTASASAPDPVRGNVYAMIAGLAYAIVIGGFRLLQKASPAKEDPGLATVALGNLVAFVACLPLALPVAESHAIDWAVIAYLGIIQIGLAYVFLTRGVRGVTALEASLLLLAEPALNPLWAGLMHGEWPGGLALAGGMMILAATGSRALRRT
jgi:drug/metabolite transporter (DMT)-like permease